MPAPAIQINVEDWPDVQATRKRDKIPSGDDPRAPKPPGNFSFGTSILGGPLFTDNYGGRRAPSPWTLIEKYKSLVYAMCSRNEKAVCRIPLRLYADSSKVAYGKPRSACDPCKVTRSVAIDLCKRGLISAGATDQVYEVRNHPVIDCLDKPDPYGYFNRTALLSLICRYNDTVGTAYLVPEGPGWRGNKAPKGPPEYLWILYSQYVIPTRQGGTPLISFFQYFNERIPFEDCIWFRQTISLRDPYGSGYSPTYAGDMYSDLEDKWVSLQDQILGLGPMPRVVATAKDPLMAPGRDEAIALRQDMFRQQSGGRAGGIYVNTGAWDFTPMTYPPQDISGMQISEYDLYRLAAIYDQPATYYTVDTNLANLQAADKQHAEMGVEPRCKRIADTLTAFTRQFDPRLFWAFDPALPEDEVAKNQSKSIMYNAGVITGNEWIQEDKYEPKPYLNEPWIAGTLKQPSMLSEQHQQGMEQQKQQLESGWQADEMAPEQAKHQQQMDKEKLKLEKQKLNGKADKRQRAMQAMIDRALERLEEAIAG